MSHRHLPDMVLKFRAFLRPGSECRTKPVWDSWRVLQSVNSISALHIHVLGRAQHSIENDLMSKFIREHIFALG